MRSSHFSPVYQSKSVCMEVRMSCLNIYAYIWVFSIAWIVSVILIITTNVYIKWKTSHSDQGIDSRNDNSVQTI